MVKLIRVTGYKDGGTESFMLKDSDNKYINHGECYYLDYRLFSITKGRWYKGYPEKSNGNIIPEGDYIEEILSIALETYRDKQNAKA